ncbi:hypothetical protein BJ875DRAFT_530749 [Amylocarpus encephaloides]|uniref:LysM domain-containing protein n=1 Tax=Amylocarpus encephaloides TaxID=45428 RepID=A0A9P7YKN2_9HELO|nr:hypothetical protein BJ875DRAFT_530749 [Amylocarpus encephaloides]
MYTISAIILAVTAFTSSVSASANATATVGTCCDVVANHTIVAGDGLADIATSFSITLAQVLQVNTQITNPRLIKINDIIAIPSKACVAAEAPVLQDPTATCVNGTEATTTVQVGESMIIIAKERLGITLQALVAVNGQIADPAKLQVGDVINIPLCCVTGGVAANPMANVVGSEGIRRRRMHSARRVQMGN